MRGGKLTLKHPGARGGFRFSTGVALVLALSCFLVSVVVGCGSSREGALEFVPDDARYVALIPYDVERIEVWDAQGILTAGLPQKEAKSVEEYLRNYYLGTLDGFLNDVETIVLAERYEGKVWILEGDLEFAHIRDELEEMGSERGEYQGYELWQVRPYPDESVALIEDDDYVILGDEVAVKDLLEGLKSSRGFLLDDENDEVAHTLTKAMGWGEGGTVIVWDDCREDRISECKTAGSVVSLERDDGLYQVKMIFLFLFRSEQSAEGEAGELGRRMGKNLSSGSVDDVAVEGKFVIITTSTDLDDLYYPYLP